MPSRALAPVRAYVALRRFGTLPRAGGYFDQAAEMVDDLEYIDSVVAEAEERERKKAAKRR